MSQHDVYLYGMTLMTTCHRLAADFPAADNYCEIAATRRFPGGETGTCAIVLANLGLSVQLDGNFLGRNTYPELLSFFETSRVSLELTTYDPEFEGLEDIVFADRHSRTAFGRFGQFYADESTRRWNPANERAIRDATVVGLDPFFFNESAAVARLCDKHRVKFTTIDCPFDSEIHSLSTVNVLSGEFLRNNYPDRQRDSLFEDYTARSRGLVIFTDGYRELWFGRRGGPLQRFAPYEVDAESTLGAGDAFKAGAIYALSQDMDDAMLVRFASATAAAACTRYPIAEFPPDLEQIARIAGESF